MPLRDLKGYLWDVCEACREVQGYTQGKTFEDYSASKLLRSAVERQLSIAGEALAQARRHYPEVEAFITQTPHIIAFRNRIIHVYLDIDDATVWGVVERYVPRLLAEAEAALEKLEGQDD
jgi:uncharacterized protein with HEPN domain